MKVKIRYRLKRKGSDALGVLDIQVPNTWKDQKERKELIQEILEKKLGEPLLWFYELK